ncbi:hypothetical protein WME99_16780 [Sorangium sp. So ce136]|uniref:hypothetical protein n=1 Tax=Sorangium sp. So ce136 TaxID=3133284 RepID=UPI003EFD1F8B
MTPTGTRARTHPARGVAPALLLSLALACLAACEDSPPRPGEPEQPAPPPPQPSAAAAGSAASSAAADPAAAAGEPADAGAPQATPAWQGTWEGRYDAKKGSVVLPPKVKDAARQKDDGKQATGAGTVTLTIEASGELKGTAKGALGDATLVGKVEDGMVRASVFPEDPRAPNAMTGILVGKLKENVIHGELRVTGPDALLVRESPVELKKK